MKGWAEELCRDIGFLEARCRELGLAVVERELRRVAREQGGVVAEIHRALLADAHLLRRDPSGLPALIYSRLRSSGWEAVRIETELRFPVGLPTLRLRHPVRLCDAELTMEGHQEGIWACALTPDGQRVVSASRDKTLRVWDMRSGELLAVLEGHDDEARDCAVMPDGRRVVSASSDRTLRIWDLETAQCITTLTGHQSRVLACSVTPDGRRIVSASSDRTLRVWDAATGDALTILAGHEGEVRDCAVTPDGRRVVSVSRDGCLRIWNLEAGTAEATLDAPGTFVDSCAVSPDGTRVIAAASDRGSKGLLHVWDLGTRQRIATWRWPSWTVTGCVVTPDGERVISTGSTIRVWELATGKELFDVGHLGHKDIVLACAVTPEGRFVVSASWDHTLRVWNLDAVRTSVVAARGNPGPVMECTPTVDGRRTVSAIHGGGLEIRDLCTGRVLRRFDVPGRTQCSRLAAVGDRRAILEQDHALRALDLETGQEIATLPGGVIDAARSVLGCDDRWVVFCDLAEREPRVWDLDTGSVLTLAEARHLGCAMTPEQRWALIENSVVVWDESGRLVSTFDTPLGSEMISLTDRRYLVWTDDRERLIHGRDPTTGETIFTVAVDRAGRHVPFHALCAITPDGRHLFTTAAASDVCRGWGLPSGAPFATLHIEGGIWCLAATNEVLCAVDGAHNLWVVEFTAPSPPRDRAGR
jgi:WD40 repeat protein